MHRIMALLMILIAAPSGFAAQIRVNFDRDAGFSRYKTYCLGQPVGPQAPQALFPKPLMERLAGYVEERLAGRGLKPVARAEDLVVTYRVSVTEHQQQIDLSDGVGPTGLGWGNTAYVATVGTVREWTLTIRIVDAKRNRSVFEGSYSQNISSRPEKNARNLTKAVNQILDKYPPRP